MKDKYKFNYAACGAELTAKPSFSMQLGINSGHGTCLKCKSFLHLMIDSDLDGDKMASEKWDDFIKN